MHFPDAKILLVDDEPLIIEWIIQVLPGLRPGWRIRTAGDGAAALAILRTEPVDVLVADIQMPGLDGLALLEAVRDDPGLAALPVVFITSRDDRASLRKGMALGADDYLTKPFTVEELVQALEARLRRRSAEPAGDRQALLQHLRQVLTARELEVLAGIGRGLVSKEIAVELGMSHQTVAVHRTHIMAKLDLHTAAALAGLAIRAGLAGPPVLPRPDAPEARKSYNCMA